MILFSTDLTTCTRDHNYSPIRGVVGKRTLHEVGVRIIILNGKLANGFSPGRQTSRKSRGVLIHMVLYTEYNKIYTTI